MDKTENFINRAKEIFPQYDYSKSIYTKAREKLIVICPEHGEFLVSPDNHLNKKSGCPLCKGKRIRNTITQKAANSFIGKAKQIHRDKYDYSKVEYFNSTTKVEIICPKNGSFKQTPVHHINCRCGCPKCSMSHGEEFLMNYFKDTNIKYISQYEVSVPSNIRITGKIFVDFYLPEYNTFVEYNGKQHYIMQKGFGGQLKFDAQLNRDNYLRAYCKENSIRLIEISYEEKDIIGYLKSKL